VYIEEVPSGVRTIMGVSTSVTAFVGYLKRGPVNEAVQIFNFGEFERTFGGLDKECEVSYAVQQFFLNGGSEAWIVRVASDSAASSDVDVKQGGSTAFTLHARAEGEWGDNLKATIDYNTATDGPFNLNVYELDEDGEIVRSEVFRNLSEEATSSRYVKSVVNDELSGSELVYVDDDVVEKPDQNGMTSSQLGDTITLTDDEPEIVVTIGSDSATANLDLEASVEYALSEVRAALEAAIRAAAPENDAFFEAQVDVFHNRLRILVGASEGDAVVTFAVPGTDETADELGLSVDGGATEGMEGLLSGDLSGYDFSDFTGGTAGGKLKVTMTPDGGAGTTKTVTLANPAGITDIDTARDQLQVAIRDGATSGDAWETARVAVYDDQRLLIIPATPNVAVEAANESGSDTTAELLKVCSDLGETAVEGVLSGEITDGLELASDEPTISVTIGPVGSTKTEAVELTSTEVDFGALRTELEIQIQGAAPADDPGFADVCVAAYDANGEHRYIVVSLAPVSFATFAPDDTTLVELGLDSATAAVQWYEFANGNDGDLPDATALKGSQDDKTGIYALENVDLFNILCIPRMGHISGDDALAGSVSDSLSAAKSLIAEAVAYCEDRRAFLIVDPPDNIETVNDIKDWFDGIEKVNSAAVYFPQIRIPDPLDEYRLRSFGPSGTIAGLYAKTDSSRGVWKAPAGIDVSLRNVTSLEYVLSDPENGTLNPLGINCLRNFPVIGNVVWGARTLEGADRLASEWKYIPVRRLALFIEESLYRGTQWVVFEPNDEPLWAQIRLNVGAFMHNLFRQGAFQGTSPRDAYFVKCDKETTTQNDIDRGMVNILVGFAPLKPAEFVIIKISQIAGEIET